LLKRRGDKGGISGIAQNRRKTSRHRSSSEGILAGSA
jgi:hypothetical protein